MRMRDPVARRVVVGLCALLFAGLVGSGCGDDIPDYGPGVPEYDPEMPLVGLWDYDPEGDYPDAMALGVLVIEAPCVYLHSFVSSRRRFLRLPDTPTRYDPATNQLWSHGRGPMTTGDEVVMAGSGEETFQPKNQDEAACEATDEWTPPGLTLLDEWKVYDEHTDTFIPYTQTEEYRDLQQQSQTLLNEWKVYDEHTDRFVPYTQTEEYREIFGD